jgi:hypothetical protein
MHTKAQLQSGGEGHRRRGVASIRTRRILGKVGGATFSGGGEAEGERRQQGGRERCLDGRPGAGKRSRVSGAGRGRNREEENPGRNPGVAVATIHRVFEQLKMLWLQMRGTTCSFNLC